MIDSIAFSGGGIKGLSYIGVVKFLHEKDMVKDIKNLSGTSVGSLVCLMINLGYTNEEMEKMALNLTTKNLEDIDINLLFEKYGLNRGEKIEIFLKYIIGFKKFDEDITFKKLYEATGKALYITACKLNDYSETVFNYINTPDMEVYKACKYSMKIPMLWAVDDIESQYIDGCFSANLPIEVLDVKNTVGFTMTADSVYSTPGDLKEYIIKLAKCIFHKSNALEIKKYKLLGYNLINIDNTGVSALDFDSPVDVKKSIIKNGYDACANNLKNI